jgi:hypothetical protein
VHGHHDIVVSPLAHRHRDFQPITTGLELANSRHMRWLLLFLTACTTTDRPSLEGTVECGPNTCNTGDVCIVETTGSQCGVNPDAGIGPYQEIGWSCITPPPDCDGVPSCDCITGPGMCFNVSDDYRRLTFGCI